MNTAIRPTPAQLTSGVVRALTGVAGLALAVALILFFLSANTVQAGHVGVVLTFGRVEPGVLQPGFHFVMPISQSIVQIDTRVLPHTFKEIDAASQELQSVKLTGTMNYHLEPTRAGELYQNVGLDFADKVIDPAFNDVIKEVVPQYPVTEILAKRDQIRALAKDRLGANLQRYGIIVDDIYISDIAFSPDYQAAIEQKQTAQQKVETEQQILHQKEIQAQQAVIDAKGKADAAVATAQGEAQANQVRTASISPQLIEYLRWQRWDGRLPMVTGSNASPFVTLPEATPTSPGPTPGAAKP
jgi:regulator of protease activity HflC (stomatin/prohibitin superfamily)